MSQTPPTPSYSFANHAPPWRTRLAEITALMRQISSITDPQEIVAVYARKMRELNGHDRVVAISRRDLPAPRYKITRSDLMDDIDPWRNPELLPVFEGGLLGQLIYGEEPVILDDFCAMPNDPAFRFLDGMRSLAAIPNYDNGVAMNMAVLLSRKQGWFDPERFPEMMWSGNLFGRATNNLVLSRKLKQAYDVIDGELKVVSDIQKSLLPMEFPYIASLKLSSDYESSSRAGGDYYDFFSLGQGRYGILMADVSGHGTPAAVLMAIVHAIAHLVPDGPHPPDFVLEFINRQLVARYTAEGGSFVTAFYGIFDENNRTLTYANAGHPSPLWKCSGSAQVEELPSENSGLPLGVLGDVRYAQHVEDLTPGEVLLLYTDGITEARNRSGQMYGTDRLKAALAKAADEKHPVPVLRNDLAAFCEGTPPGDDRTMLVAQVR